MVSKIKNIDSLLAFEASRKEARMCRQEFEQVKKRRYDLFSQCFEHVSVSIDQIYKKLCRNNSAQVRTFYPKYEWELCVVRGVLFCLFWREITTTIWTTHSQGSVSLWLLVTTMACVLDPPHPTTGQPGQARAPLVLLRLCTRRGLDPPVSKFSSVVEFSHLYSRALRELTLASVVVGVRWRNLGE